MSGWFLKVLLNWPKPYISGTDLTHILGKSGGSRYAIIKRAVKEGTLISMRRDLYVIKDLKKPLVDSFEIALSIRPLAQLRVRLFLGLFW